MDINAIKKQAQDKIKRAETEEQLNAVFNYYLAKNSGVVTKILRSLKNLSRAERIKIGPEANDLKTYIRKEVRQRINVLEKRYSKKRKIDVSRPGYKLFLGHLHPLTLVALETEQIFQSMGFSIVYGPEIEDEWHNFDALNFPKHHPARNMQDTFWLDLPKTSKGNLLLRTHTSPVQVRYMEKHRPPFRIIVPGRVFRHEATDASHEANFYQLEGLMVGKTISVANFKAIIQEFLRRFFHKSVHIRLRSSFFPFTEPSFEVDVTCPICGGKGCRTCQYTGWIELLGAGMVHPNVLKNSGLIPHQSNKEGWEGFAFGIGMDRLAMIKYKIDDIRLFYKNDLRFLRQF